MGDIMAPFYWGLAIILGLMALALWWWIIFKKNTQREVDPDEA